MTIPDRVKTSAGYLMEVGLYIFLLLMFAGHLGSLREIGFYLATGTWAVGFLLTGDTGFDWNRPLYILTLALVVSGVLSALANQPVTEAVYELKRSYLKVALLVSATFYLFQEKDVKKRGLLVLGAGGMLYLLYAIYLVGSDLITKGHMDYGRDRYFATVLLFFLPFSLLNAKIAQGSLSRYLWVALSVMLSAVIIIVGVRGGWIALSFVLILWYLLTRKGRSINKKGVLLSLVAVLVILLATVSLFPDYFREMKSHTFQKIQLSLRLEAWQGYIDLSMKRPVFGHGLSEEDMKEDYLSHYTEIKGHPPGPYKPLTPHNQYLYLFYQQGVIGVGIYILILALVIKGLLRRRPRLHAPPTFNLLFFYASALSLLGEYLVRCLLEDRSFIPLSFLLGLILSSEKEERPPE